MVRRVRVAVWLPALIGRAFAWCSNLALGLWLALVVQYHRRYRDQGLRFLRLRDTGADRWIEGLRDMGEWIVGWSVL